MRISSVNGKFTILATCLMLAGCDGPAEQAFEKFCTENIPQLPENLTPTDGVEFRGNFNLSADRWKDSLEFVEFSKRDILVGSSSRSEFKNPNQLKSPKYRMELVPVGAQECTDYWSISHRGASVDTEFNTPEYFEETTKRFGGLCQGLFAVDEFTSEYVYEQMSVHEVAKIHGRPVDGIIYRAFKRDNDETVGELRMYWMPTHPLWPDLPEFSSHYRCETGSGEMRGNLNDIRLFFE